MPERTITVRLDADMGPEQASVAIKAAAKRLAEEAAWWYGVARADSPEHVALRLELQLKQLLSAADV